MEYTEEYNELMANNVNNNINLGNTGQRVGANTIGMSQLTPEVRENMECFYAGYLGMESSFTRDGNWHTMDLSDKIGTGIKTLMLNVYSHSNGDGDSVKFGCPDDHNIRNRMYVDISVSGPDVTLNNTTQYGMLFVTTNEAGEIDYEINSDVANVAIYITGYFKTKMIN